MNKHFKFLTTLAIVFFSASLVADVAHDELMARIIHHAIQEKTKAQSCLAKALKDTRFTQAKNDCLTALLGLSCIGIGISNLHTSKCISVIATAVGAATASYVLLKDDPIVDDAEFDTQDMRHAAKMLSVAGLLATVALSTYTYLTTLAPTNAAPEIGRLGWEWNIEKILQEFELAEFSLNAPLYL